MYFQDDNYWTVNVATRAVINITKSVKTFRGSRIRRDDHAKAAIWRCRMDEKRRRRNSLRKYDLWKVSPDGSHAARLTDGAADQIRHRYVRLNPEDEFIDLTKPVYVSLFGDWTKKSGYARLNLNANIAPRTLPSGSTKASSRLAKAKDAESTNTSRNFRESPNAFVGGPDLKNAKQVTDTNHSSPTTPGATKN